MESQTVVQEVIYNAPVEKVWQALTDKDQMKQWYFDIPDFNTAPGSRFDFYEGPKKKYRHRATITALIPLQKLQHTWAHPDQSKGTSLLTWELFPKGDQTRVHLTHSGLEQLADGGPAFAKENYEQGWNTIMNTSLRNFLER
ncbi:SRPBCC family protein [Niabella soli]|uniref:ATPase n=1 Tax=Niabella soli DSM 19437 TaxID=929713 RepID=W0F3F8_9BACT|nr:SRPBCC domain-containing protein [Niabella soli]AHF15841.1 ATPase [Niabella soli DSM 19437]